jgi:hypothetical protein
VDEQTTALLNSALAQIDARGDIELTLAARRLIELSIDAIETDPLPYQQFQPNRTRRDCQLLAIERLPQLLRFLSRTRGARTIGALQLLEAAPQLIGIYLIFRGPD